MRLGIFSDPHCGHLLGLTPKSYQRGNWRLSHASSKFWDWFVANTKNKKYDVAAWLADMCEGEGKHDSTFHLTTNIEEQIDMAIEIVNTVGAKRNIFVYGTPYHTSGALDYESILARHFDEEIKTRYKAEIGGVKFIFRHVLGKTSTPVGGDIMLRKESLWDIIENPPEERADWLFFGHVHEFRSVSSVDCTAVAAPALKIGARDFDKYARRMSGGFYHVGFIEGEIKKGRFLMEPPIIWPYKVEEGYEKI